MIMNIPIEMILHIMRFCDITTINNFKNTCKRSKRLILIDFRYIIKNSFLSIERNYYKTLSLKSSEKTFYYHLLYNYPLEMERISVMNEYEMRSYVSYEKIAAGMGFYNYKNFKKLINNGFSRSISIDSIRMIDRRRIEKMLEFSEEGFSEQFCLETVRSIYHTRVSDLIKLKKAGFLEANCSRAVRRIETEKIKHLVELKRMNHLENAAIDLCENLNETQLEYVFRLKSQGFQNWVCVHFIRNYNFEKIEKIIELRRLKVNQGMCKKIADDLSTRKIDLFIAMKENSQNFSDNQSILCYLKNLDN
jgi:hypothetical protein